MKHIRYLLEAAALWFALIIFRLIGPDKSSALGSWIGRTIGPRLAASRKAMVNLRASFPEKPEPELVLIMTQMWDNLGRVVAEYPHLKFIATTRMDIYGSENFNDLPLGKKNPFISLGGHLANWELFPFLYNYIIDTPISAIYREPNNPYTAALLDKCRNPERRGRYIPKSPAGTRDMLKTVMGGGRIGILIDQKYNQGAPIEFFGRPAMTSTAVAQLALKYGTPILPMQIERLEGCHFRATIYPPMEIAGKSEDDVMLAANRLLEDWIRKRPGQWLWLHRRWDSKALKDMEERDAA